MKGKNMSNETIYQPGHSVHFIQARKALEEVDTWKPVSLSHASGGVIEIVESDGSKWLFHCRDTDRLLAVLATEQVPKSRNGGHLAFLAPHNVLVVPCAEFKKAFPKSARVYPSVVYLENGAALWSPATDGTWNLFSVIWIGMIN
jgi:hypothetical protein